MRTNLWILSYDIARPRSRRAVAEWALDHGDRLQRSLYALTLTIDEAIVGERKINNAISTETDRAMLRPVCRQCRRETRFQGVGSDTTAREPFWIV